MFKLTKGEYEYLKELAKTALQFLPSHYKITFNKTAEDIEVRALDKLHEEQSKEKSNDK